MSSKELLAEYATLAAKLRHINETLQEINSLDVVQLIDKIRVVERKMVQEQDQQQQQQQSPYSQQGEFQDEEAQLASSTAHQGHLSQSNGESDGYANKDPLFSSTGGRGEAEYGQESHNDLERMTSSQPNIAEDHIDALPPHAASPMPQTPSRYRSNHPYHHYRSDPLLESTYRRTTLAAAHAATPAAASSSSSAHLPSRSHTSGIATSQSAGTMPHHRTSNVLDQFEAMTGQRSLLSLSRGYARRQYDEGASTNRPRYF
ncbi:hypothetical protein BGZ73_004416 [Actinomortierella ambigua]|nr:hypothetical protein BGZ73_004416 [Actinomortierella ambigua]